MKRSFSIIRAVKQGSSVEWWSHSGPMRRPSVLLLQCWTPVILRSPPNAPGYQTPETLWRKNQNNQNETQPRRLTIARNDPLRVPYLLQHHLCPKPSGLLFALQKHKQRAGLGYRKHRTKCPVDRRGDTTIKSRIRHGHCSGVIHVLLFTIFMSREWTRLGLLLRMSQILTCLSADAVTRHPLTWLLSCRPGKTLFYYHH